MTDESFMRRALALAALGRGAVEPNPMVGAVLVRDGVVIGEGFHRRYGGPHAEVEALAGIDARGATLYVTLEPCSHFGKTPPCANAVVAAGVARVVAAMADPFPQVSGQGFDRLRAAGVAVDVGPLGAEAQSLNAPYLKLLAKGRPYVHLKWAMTLDGKTATASGDSKWISNEASRRRVHELRGRVDAVLVGIGTALADDPLLTARPPGPRVPLRVVMDRSGRLPPSSALVKSLNQGPVLVASDAPRPHLTAAGVEVFVGGLVELLDELGRRRMTNVLVEGGGTLAGAFFDAGEVDEVHAFIAPKLVGGASARGPLGGLGVGTIAEAAAVEWEVTTEGGDIYASGRIRR